MSKVPIIEAELEKYRRMRNFDMMLSSSRKVGKLRSEPSFEQLISLEVLLEKILVEHEKMDFIADTLEEVNQRPKLKPDQVSDIKFSLAAIKLPVIFFFLFSFFFFFFIFNSS